MSESSERKEVLYCGVCSLPPEYCEFLPSRKKCEQWLKNTHPSEHERLYSDQAVADKLAMTTLSEDKEAKEAAKMEKAEQKTEARMAREMEKKMASKVVIKRMERNKRKCVTAVFGLHVFGIDLKSTAKMFASHFACGGSVAKNPQGEDEIVVQGDFSDEIRELIMKKFPSIPAENVEFGTEDKKKKKK
ncbi:Translation machinery-associated protein 22 [Coemansia sp. RSA 989]|nr:Translation machinery-associated protein 22 [Coemansia sp. RSA 1086]KAJ1866949.1 Translation machinery-associated protein 22 [Coemansia sp. RSA 989]KAJ1874182.1 Translation machinery-associated protein 22 [Coemansia sp. RSA 990]KAJ2632200.1 Translation machinery-associated protein 22 [Coemansia sp. RSA 1290]KAJ2649718.1 Translation machinery-associated protein 22 [Coemansia sp. RSA 1250]KAJ2670841.1 Translation machinery-associated protein 22 [Coemansia sp. RSA 1085]